MCGAFAQDESTHVACMKCMSNVKSYHLTIDIQDNNIIYLRKIKEGQGDSIYGVEENPRFVTKQKAYGFIIYHAHHKKITKKGGKKSTTDEAVQRFNRVDYDKVLELISTFDHEEADWSHFGDVGGFDIVNQHLCAINVLI